MPQVRYLLSIYRFSSPKLIVGGKSRKTQVKKEAKKQKNTAQEANKATRAVFH